MSLLGLGNYASKGNTAARQLFMNQDSVAAVDDEYWGTGDDKEPYSARAIPGHLDDSWVQVHRGNVEQLVFKFR